MNTIKKWTVAGTICGLLGVGITSCGSSDTSARAADTPTDHAETDPTDSDEVVVTQAQFAGSDMELGTLQPYTFADRVSANGYLEVPPQNKAAVSVFTQGYIHNIDLLVGDRVEKGQFLISLINPEYLQLQQDYLDTKEQLVFLKADYERQQTLAEEKIASQKSFLKAQSDYKSALARYQGMRQKLKLMNIDPARVEAGTLTSTINLYAPITGIITEIHTSLGSFVSPSDVILEIINKDHEHLELMVFERDVLKLKEGQPIEFRIPNTGDDTFSAEIHRVGQSIDPEKRTITVHADLEEGNPRFVTGMYVEAQILTDTVAAPALPEEAIVEEEGQAYLLAMKSQQENQYTFERLAVRTGRTSDGRVEVLSHPKLTSDRQILVKGAFALIGEGGGGHSH